MRRSVLAVPLCVLFAVMSATGHAHEYYAPNFTLEHPWSLPTEAGRTACVYGRFESISAGDRLLGGESIVAEKIEIRSGKAGSAEEKTLAAFDIPAGPDISLRPDEACIAYVKLKMPLLWGRAYPLTLIFERAGRIEMEVSIGAH